MNNLKYRISLDLQETQAPVVLKAMRFDTKCSIIARLTSKFLPFPLGEGVKAIFVGYKPDGTSLFNDCTIVSDAIIYDFTTQTTTAVGVVECEFKLFDKNGDPLLTSPRFSLLVENTIFDEHVFVESTDEHNALLEFIIATTDDELNETSEFPISNKVIATELKGIKDDLYNKVGFSGDYNELKNKPSVATSTSDGFMSAADKVKVDSFDDHDHEISDVNGLQEALGGKSPTSHKHTASDMSGLADVSWSGSYNDLKDKPNIAATIKVDSELSAASENPVQNKVIVAELSKLAVTTSVMSSTGADLTLENTEEAKLRGLNIYGKTTQKGTPTQDAPIPLENVDGDGVVAKVEGANLIPFPDSKSATQNGITATFKDSKITLSGTSTANVWLTAFTMSLGAGEYTLSSDSIPVNVTVYIFSNTEYFSIRSGALVKTKTFPQGNYNFVIEVTAANVTLNSTFQVMLNKGTTAIPYQPYSQQQIITTIPNGLCGVPVTSGGNYIDANGQQWICDEIDFERGVMIKRTHTQTFKGTEPFSALGSTGDANAFFYLIDESIKPYVENNEGFSLSSHFESKRIISSTTDVGHQVRKVSTEERYRVLFRPQNASGMTAAQFQTWLKSNPTTITYALATSTEIPLSAEDIAEYKKLHTNYPTTIITSEGADMKVSYIVRGGMPSNTALADLMDDEDHRLVSDEDIARWDNKSDFSGSYNDLKDKPSADYSEAEKQKLSGIEAGANNYTLPSAGDNSFGGVIDIGATNVTIREGQISVNDYGHKHTIENVDGLREVLNSKSEFSGNYNDLTNKPTIPSAYTLPTASSTVKGGVKVGNGLSIDANGALSVSGAGGEMTWIAQTQELSLSSSTILSIGVDNPDLTYYAYCFYIRLRDNMGRDISHTVQGFYMPSPDSNDVNVPSTNVLKVRSASISAGLPQTSNVCAYPQGVQCTYNLSDSSMSKVTATIHGWYKVL